MAGIVKHMSSGIDVRTGVTIENIESDGTVWWAAGTNGEHFKADVVLMTAPAEQALALCEPFRPLLGKKVVSALQSIQYEPCYALLVRCDGPSAVPPPGYARPEDGPLSWIADNNQKGVSAGQTAITLHARGQWTKEHWDDSFGQVAGLMLQAAETFIGSRVVDWQVHRWRYSQPVRVQDSAYLCSVCPSPIVFAGDAFGGPRVEGAYVSGLEAAEAILHELT